MSGRVWWVLSPTDGTAHLLAIEGPGGVVLATQCGQLLPLGVVAHDRLPSRHLCRECFAAYLLPDPVFARKTPAGCRLNDAPESVPGGQPVPAPPAVEVALPVHDHPVAGDPPVAPVPRGRDGEPAGPGGLPRCAAHDTVRAVAALRGVLRYDGLPRGQLCRECVAAYPLPLRCSLG